MMQYFYSLKSTLQKVAFTERSMEKKLPALLGDYDRNHDRRPDQQRPTDQQTYGQTGS